MHPSIVDLGSRAAVAQVGDPEPQTLLKALEARVWPKIRPRLSMIDPTEIRRMLLADSDLIPQWSGHTVGYNIV